MGIEIVPIKSPNVRTLHNQFLKCFPSTRAERDGARCFIGRDEAIDLVVVKLRTVIIITVNKKTTAVQAPANIHVQ